MGARVLAVRGMLRPAGLGGQLDAVQLVKTVDAVYALRGASEGGVFACGLYLSLSA